MMPFDAVILILILTVSSIGLYFFADGLIDGIFHGSHMKTFFGAILIIGSLLALFYFTP